MESPGAREREDLARRDAGSRGRLAWRLLLATAAPAAVALSAFGFFAHVVARRTLEDELGRRLAAVASGVAAQILPEQVRALGPGDEDSRTYRSVQARLAEARARHDVRRLVVLAADGTARGDSDGRLALGATPHELTADRDEIARALAGQDVASPLFAARDGTLIKRGYAPVAAGVAVVVAEGDADFYAPLSRFRRWLFGWGAAALVLLMGVTVLVARRITRPVGRLAAAAARIGAGDLARPVPVETRDEIGALARAIEEMRGALQVRDERMRMMLAGIAHEVRNPLGGLELFAGLLRESLGELPGGNQEALRAVERIDREVAYLNRVVSEFLDYARRPAPDLARVALAPLLADVVELCQAGARSGGGEPGAPITTGCEPAELEVRADPTQLRRALLNLVRNAQAAAGPGGRVVVRAEVADGGPQRVSIAVRDSGPGVPDALRDQIFAPFFTTREKGTGLGLAFVRDIVRDHGGRIVVERAPEGGACFRVLL